MKVFGQISQGTQDEDARTKDGTARKGRVKVAGRAAYAIDVTITISIPFRAQPERPARLARHGIGVRDNHGPSLIGATCESVEPRHCDLALAIGLGCAVPVPRIAEVVPDILIEVLILSYSGTEVAALVTDAVLEDH